MDSSSVNVNVTVDDFDTVLVFDDHGQWTTPDPSSRDFNGNDPQYLRGTYHLTDRVGAAVGLNFTGESGLFTHVQGAYVLTLLQDRRCTSMVIRVLVSAPTELSWTLQRLRTVLAMTRRQTAQCCFTGQAT